MKIFSFRTYLYLGLCIVLYQTLYAGEPDKNVNIPSQMPLFRKQLLEMQPYLHSFEAFTSKRNNTLIRNALKDMSHTAKSLRSHRRLQTDGFSIPVELFQNSLGRAYDNFKFGRKQQAYHALRKAVSGCSSCHSQAGPKTTPFWTADSYTLIGSDFERAEFLFILREYPQALDRYASFIKNNAGKKEFEREVSQALNRILLIHLFIERDFSATQSSLGLISTYPNQPDWFKKDIHRYQTELADLQKKNLPNPEHATLAEMEATADATLRNVFPYPILGFSHELTAMAVSGWILHYLNTHPASPSPRLLFWVGQTLDDIDDYWDIGMGPEFLKRCIKDFPNDPVSQRCYNALMNKWVFESTGSLGTFIPRGHKIELQRLRLLLPPGS